MADGIIKTYMTPPGRDRYNLNDSVTLHVEFRVLPSAALTDPTTVSLKVRDPNGTTSTYTYAGVTITKDATGKYSKALTPATGGLWAWSWHGTGAVARSAEGSFEIEASSYSLD